MQEHMAAKGNEGSGVRFVRNYDALEHIDPGPDSYVDLAYETHKNPEYVRICARNHHPSKTIHAYFYTLHEKGGAFRPRRNQRTHHQSLPEAFGENGFPF